MSTMTPRMIAERGTFMVKEVGSSVHGTNISGADDLDLMGVCFQLPAYLLGLRRFEQYIYRSAEARARFDPDDDQRKHGRQPPSEPGDIDLVIYSVQKYLYLALSGNPSVLVLLFSPKRHPEYEIPYRLEPELTDRWVVGMSDLIPSIASKQAGAKFLGYLRAQRERMLGTRGQMRVTRKELIDLYGFDNKYAMQAVRLGLQGIEYMNTGKLVLPMSVANASELRSIRRGEMTFTEVIEWVDNLEEDLKQAIDNSQLPKAPNYDKVNQWLVDSQLEYFEWLGKVENLPTEYLAKLP